MKSQSTQLTLLLIASLLVALTVRMCESMPPEQISERLDLAYDALDADNDTTPATETTKLPTAESTATTVTLPPGTATSKATPPPPPPASHGFDAGSFVGGIALGAGLVALGMFAYMYYKRRTGRNYQRM